MGQNYNSTVIPPNTDMPPTVTVPFHPEHLTFLDKVGLEYSIAGANACMLNHVDVVISCDTRTCIALFLAGFKMGKAI